MSRRKIMLVLDCPLHMEPAYVHELATNTIHSADVGTSGLFTLRQHTKVDDCYLSFRDLLIINHVLHHYMTHNILADDDRERYQVIARKLTKLLSMG